MFTFVWIIVVALGMPLIAYEGNVARDLQRRPEGAPSVFALRSAIYNEIRDRARAGDRLAIAHQLGGPVWFTALLSIFFLRWLSS